jgi:acetyl-CoA synthetase
VVFVPELPKTPAGKIHRRKLREQELATAAASTTEPPKAAPAAHV